MLNVGVGSLKLLFSFVLICLRCLKRKNSDKFPPPIFLTSLNSYALLLTPPHTPHTTHPHTTLSHTHIPTHTHTARFLYHSQAIVALSGAHAVGRCHTDRSGYWGPWTYSETTFSNDYFKKLVDPSQSWSPKTQHMGKKWTGPPQFVNKQGDLMMLHTDMALTWEPAFKKWVDIYADDEERWFNDFSKYYQQLNELGCKNLNGGGRQFIFVSVYLCLFVLFQCSTATAVPFSFLLHVKSLITYKFCYCLSSIFPNSSFICSLAKKSKREEHFTQPFYSYTKKYIHGVSNFPHFHKCDL